MNVSSINANASATLAASIARNADLAAINATAPTTKSDASKPAGQINDPKAVKKAASQFEAIILRQLLAPTIDPLMSGGMGGGEKDAGGGVYGYMLTDVMADSLSKGGGLGLARMLQKQFSPPTHPAAAKTGTAAAPVQLRPAQTL